MRWKGWTSNCQIAVWTWQLCLTIDKHASDKCGSKSLNPCQLACSTIKCKLSNRRAISPAQTTH